MMKIFFLMSIMAFAVHGQSITNKKTGEKLFFDFYADGVEITHVDQAGYEENVNTLETSSGGEGIVHTNNDQYRYESVDFLYWSPNDKMPLLFSVTSLGILPLCDEIIEGLDDARRREMSLVSEIGSVLAEVVTMPVCLVSMVPGFATVAVAALGESGVHGAKYLFNKEAIALRKLKQVYKGEDAWASNRVFRKILNDLREL